MCFCDNDNGNGGCDDANEFVKVTSPDSDASIIVIAPPSLGRISGTSHMDNVRGIEGKSHTYSIKGSLEEGYEVADGDKVFFQPDDCSTVPGADGAAATLPISLISYDPTLTSSTYQSARVVTPITLTTATGAPRTLVACFATSESLTGDTAARNYVRLADGLTIIPTPRLGPVAVPGDLRSVSGTGAVFNVYPFGVGDQIYFKKQATQGVGADTDCTLSGTAVTSDIISAIPLVSTTSETAALMGHSFAVDGSGKVTIPALTEELDANGDPIPLYLTSCFVPAGSMDTLQEGANCPMDSPNTLSNSNGGTCTTTLANAIKLTDDLQIFPEPTDMLVTSWFRSHVYELRFTQPQWGTWGTKTFASGQEGDIVVLQKDNCSNVHLIDASTYSVGLPHSAKMTLGEYGNETTGDEKGGVAQVMALATGKVNELSDGLYYICYATKNSEGDDEADFKQLARQVEILPDTATRPGMSVPRSVLLGGDIHVHWTSTVNLQTRLQTQNSWIGLYRQGECMSANGGEWQDHDNRIFSTQILNSGGVVAPVSSRVNSNADTISPVNTEYLESDAHECYVAYQYIESGVEAGTVIFSQQDYKAGGTYDVRFFQGDSRNVQGCVCRGLSNTPHETYIQCSLESALTSGPITVIADRSKMEDLDSVPGMEVLFNGNRGRYSDTGDMLS
jgi:hypothetical protein